MNAETSSEPTPDRYIDQMLADVELLAAAVERGPRDAAIEACPGWDLDRLTEHVGQIHRWARFCIANARPPSVDDAPMEAFDSDRATDWLRAGAAELATTMRATDPGAPSWHPFPVDAVAGVWPRRQAHETSMHRWDAERAVGIPSPIEPWLAGDGIDEYFEIAIPRLIVREAVELPTQSLHVHCTDIDGEWLVWTDGDGFHMIREHQKGDAALRGPAEAILLRLWGRESSRANELSPVGDESALSAWLAVAGM